MNIRHYLGAWFDFVFGPSSEAPAAVTAAANAIAKQSHEDDAPDLSTPEWQGKFAGIPWTQGHPKQSPVAQDTGDGTHVGDDPDAGAIGA